jgi:transcriptional regulator with XRE-family HTH domain
VKPIDPDRLLRDAGRRLAECREARGLTQQALAEELGVSMRYVQRVESVSAARSPYFRSA